MYELKKIGKVFTSKFVGTGPSSYEKRIYRAAVSQRLRNTALADIMTFITKEIRRHWPWPWKPTPPPPILFQPCTKYITKYHYTILLDLGFQPSLIALISSIASTWPKRVPFIGRFYSSIVSPNAIISLPRTNSVLCRASIRTHLTIHSVLWFCSVYHTSRRREEQLRYAGWITMMDWPSTRLPLQRRKASFDMVNQRLSVLWAEVITVNVSYNNINSQLDATIIISLKISISSTCFER